MSTSWLLLYVPAWWHLDRITAMAQCLCSGGVAPNTVTYLDTISPTNASSSSFSFPKFDPSIGTLGCVGLNDTISGITTTTVWNLASSKTEYQFLLTVANNISGPGISVTDAYTTPYGPDSLNAKGDSPATALYMGPTIYSPTLPMHHPLQTLRLIWVLPER